MSVPAQRRTKSSAKRRASHFALKKANLVACPKCKHPVLPHHVCTFCGVYAGKNVLDIKSKNEKGKKKEEKEEKPKEKNKK